MIIDKSRIIRINDEVIVYPLPKHLFLYDNMDYYGNSYEDYQAISECFGIVTRMCSYSSSNGIVVKFHENSAGIIRSKLGQYWLHEDRGRDPSFSSRVLIKDCLKSMLWHSNTPPMYDKNIDNENEDEVYI